MRNGIFPRKLIGRGMYVYIRGRTKSSQVGVGGKRRDYYKKENYFDPPNKLPQIPFSAFLRSLTLSRSRFFQSNPPKAPAA